MTTVWIPILLGAAALTIVSLAKWRYRIEMAEMGTVSQQWLAEHRAHDRHDSER
jgi:hypothetical protein